MTLILLTSFPNLRQNHSTKFKFHAFTDELSLWDLFDKKVCCLQYLRMYFLCHLIIYRVHLYANHTFWWKKHIDKMSRMWVIHNKFKKLDRKCNLTYWHWYIIYLSLRDPSIDIIFVKSFTPVYFPKLRKLPPKSTYFRS